MPIFISISTSMSTSVSMSISLSVLYRRLISLSYDLKVWRGGKKTHASSPSTSGKTHEKTCPIQTRLKTAHDRW